jgi:GNAT superfamily N-acetyltransferase
MRAEDLHVRMMDDYDDHQEITREYRKRKLGWGYRVKKLRKPKIKQTSDGGKNCIHLWFIPLVHLRQYYPGEPLVFAAFRGRQVKAFAVWDHYIGKEKGYAVLLRLFVSRDCRRMGLGRQLFNLCAGAARAEGAQKLFISGAPTAETQEFYRSMGCTIAKKRIAGPIKHVLQEHMRPKTDVPLEYILQ